MHLDWQIVSETVTIVGLVAVIWQLWKQRQRQRLEFLSRLYAELDTPESRLARKAIYDAGSYKLQPEELRADEKLRRQVDDTVAMLDRVAYPILTKQVPPRDAYELYSGVMLRVSFLLWPYIEGQKREREESPLVHGGSYRRYLEKLVRQWAPDFAAKNHRTLRSPDGSTYELLRQAVSKGR